MYRITGGMEKCRVYHSSSNASFRPARSDLFKMILELYARKARTGIHLLALYISLVRSNRM